MKGKPHQSLDCRCDACKKWLDENYPVKVLTFPCISPEKMEEFRKAWVEAAKKAKSR